MLLKLPSDLLYAIIEYIDSSDRRCLEKTNVDLLEHSILCNVPWRVCNDDTWYWNNPAPNEYLIHYRKGTEIVERQVRRVVYAEYSELSVFRSLKRLYWKGEKHVTLVGALFASVGMGWLNMIEPNNQVQEMGITTIRTPERITFKQHCLLYGTTVDAEYAGFYRLLYQHYPALRGTMWRTINVDIEWNAYPAQPSRVHVRNISILVVKTDVVTPETTLWRNRHALLDETTIMDVEHRTPEQDSQTIRGPVGKPGECNWTEATATNIQDIEEFRGSIQKLILRYTPKQLQFIEVFPKLKKLFISSVYGDGTFQLADYQHLLPALEEVHIHLSDRRITLGPIRPLKYIYTDSLAVFTHATVATTVVFKARTRGEYQLLNAPLTVDYLTIHGRFYEKIRNKSSHIPTILKSLTVSDGASVLPASLTTQVRTLIVSSYNVPKFLTATKRDVAEPPAKKRRMDPWKSLKSVHFHKRTVAFGQGDCEWFASLGKKVHIYTNVDTQILAPYVI